MFSLNMLYFSLVMKQSPLFWKEFPVEWDVIIYFLSDGNYKIAKEPGSRHSQPRNEDVKDSGTCHYNHIDNIKIQSGD